MCESSFPIGLPPIANAWGEAKTKKADVVEYPQAFDHIGLLVNEPPGRTGLPFS
jgi:hypothetical protein